jgi:hypothetical protein
MRIESLLTNPIHRSFGITTKNITERVQGYDWNGLIRGLGLSKVEAILASPFEEVLLLDPDNYVLRDPTYLFETKMFKQ